MNDGKMEEHAAVMSRLMQLDFRRLDLAMGFMLRVGSCC